MVINGGSLKDYLQRDFWGTELISSKSHLSWRPLVTLLFRLEKLCIPSEYLLTMMHFINMIIHLLNVHLFYEITNSTIGSYIFGCHPMSTEAVNALVGRADLLITTLTFITYKSQNIRNQLIIASISIFIKGIFTILTQCFFGSSMECSFGKMYKETGLVLFGFIFLRARMSKTSGSTVQILFATLSMIYFRFQISRKSIWSSTYIF